MLAAGGLKGEELARQVEARISEAVLRTPLRDAGEWRRQVAYLAEVGERPNVTQHVVPFSAGLHGLVSAETWHLRGPDGRTVAYVESTCGGGLSRKRAQWSACCSTTMPCAIWRSRLPGHGSSS